MSNQSHKFIHKKVDSQRGVFGGTLTDRDGELSGEVIIIERGEDYSRKLIRSTLGTTISHYEDWKLYDGDPVIKRTIEGILTLVSLYTDSTYFGGWDNCRMDEKESRKARDFAKQVFDAIQYPNEQTMPTSPVVEERLPIENIMPNSDDGEFWFMHKTQNEVHSVLLPRKEQGIGYPQSRMTALLLFLSEMITGRTQMAYRGEESTLSFEEHLSGMDESGIHSDMMFRLNGLGRAISFFLNSLSWTGYKAYDFDIQELRSKCGAN